MKSKLRHPDRYPLLLKYPDGMRTQQAKAFPWRVKDGPGMHPSVYGADGRSVFSTGNARGRTEEECLLNCQLAAAAPDLLMWAKDLLDRLPELLPKNLSLSIDTADSIRMLRKAIQKAEEG